MKRLLLCIALAAASVTAHAEYIGYMQTTTASGAYDGSQMVFSNAPCSLLGKGMSAEVNAWLKRTGGYGMMQLDSAGKSQIFGCYKRVGALVNITWYDDTTHVVRASMITWSE